MALLDNKFKDILKDLANPVNHISGDKQVYYLTFLTEDVLNVKKHIHSWESLAKHYGYKSTIVSIAQILNKSMRENPYRKTWKNYDDWQDPYALEELFAGLSSNVIQNEVVGKAILDIQNTVSKQTKPLLLITDLEALHPFSRFSPIEESIYSKLQVPLIVLYPGKKNGSSLEFLGLYPESGNYRSKHF